MFRSKVLLLVVAVTAMFALPAAAQANPFWFAGGKKLGPAGVQVAGVGAAVYKSGGLVIGPCEVEVTETLWNSATMGEGERTAHKIKVPCPTNLPGCTVVAAEAKKLPWELTLVAGPRVEIKGKAIDFTFANVPGCAALAGKKMPLEGNVGGNFLNSFACVEYSEESGLTFGMTSATLSGEECKEVTEGEGAGEPLTAE